MAQLSGEQRKIAKRIIGIGRRRHEPRRLIVSALATGLAESGLRNLKYGDASSQGWRQELQTYYKNPTNLKASINRYYSEAKTDVPGGAGKRNLKKYPVGAISQYIQASAFPSHFTEQVPEARSIYKGLVKRGGIPAGGNSQRGMGKAGGGEKRTVKIPGIDKSQEAGLAALDLIRNRFDPGAFQSYAQALPSLQSKPSRTITVGTGKNKYQVPLDKTKSKGKKGGTAPLPGKHVGKWEKKYGVPAARLGGTHLYGGAVDIGRKVASMFGLTVTSTNSGGHVAGSYHYSNRAVDISGTSAQMKKAFKYIQSHVPHGKLTELFYDPIGHYWDNGHKVHGAIGDHSDHVHLAI